MKPKIAIIGPGRVGATLGRLLVLADHEIVAVSSSNPAGALEAQAFIGAGDVRETAAGAAAGAGIVMICVPDRAIPTVASELATAPLAADAIVFHTSGLASSRQLESIRSAHPSIALASAHPLQSFARPAETVGKMEGVTWTIEGDGRALAVLERLVTDLGGRPVVIETEAKPLYHAAAVVASNYFVALLDIAATLAEASGVPRASFLPAFRPLMEGSLANFARLGPVDGLTGPIARGDTTTIDRHLSSIRDRLPHLAPIYRALGRHTLHLAQGKKGFPAGTAEEIEKLFAES